MVKILTIIVNYRTAELAKKCLAAVARERSSGLSLSAILVDGNSGDGSAERLRDYLTETGFDQWVRLLPLTFNGGFGWANNQAILSHSGVLPDYIYLLNPDTEVETGAVEALAEVLNQRPEVAAVGSQLLEYDGRPAASAFRFPSAAREFVRGTKTFALHRLLRIAPLTIHIDRPCAADWVTGASVMLRSDALAEVGLFDDGFFLYFEEVELMHRLRRRGWKIWSSPESRVRHVGAASTGVSDQGGVAKPPYWFRSRNRYFTSTGGVAYSHFVNIAWMLGYVLIGLPRRMLSSSRGPNAVTSEARGILKAGLRPQKGFDQGSIAKLGSPPGILPQWTR